MKIDQSVWYTLSDAIEITGKDYHIKWFDKDLFEGYIDEDDLLNLIDDVTYRADKYKYELEELRNDLLDNYRPISKAEQYEIHERDFYE